MLQRLSISQIIKIVIFFAETTNDLTLKAVVKWRNQSSILAIASEYKNGAKFLFNFVSKEDVLAEIKELDVGKAIQENDVPVKIIKTNENLFVEVTCYNNN